MSHIYTIIGVVKNFHYETMRENIGALALFQFRSTGKIAIKLKTNNYAASLNTRSLWKKEAPDNLLTIVLLTKNLMTPTAQTSDWAKYL